MIKHLNCADNVSPNSVRCWFDGTDFSHQTAAVRQLVQPLVKAKQRMKAGISLCRTPGSGVPAEDVVKQKAEESMIQKPLIPALLIGDLPQNDYHEELKQGIDAYTPINQQLWDDFQANFDKLRRLRDIAREHIWKDLHGEWLPRLREESGFHKEFNTMIKRALRIAKFDPWLDKVTDIAIEKVILLTAAGIGMGATAIAGGDLTLGAGVGSGLGKFLSSVAETKKANGRKQVDGLVKFYQRARRVT